MIASCRRLARITRGLAAVGAALYLLGSGLPASAQSGADGCEPAWLPTFGELPGVDLFATCAISFDDGSGPALFVGGLFTQAGGVEASSIARWDGQEWSALGAGVGGFDARIRDMVVFDDGRGPALYVAGTFETAGGTPAKNVARWDGREWSALGDGLNLTVTTLTVFDDGGGSRLIAGGYFFASGPTTVIQVAAWDGDAWSPVGGGVNDVVHDLTVHLDDGGPVLVAAVSHTPIFGLNTNRVLQFDGTGWSQVGGSMNNAVNAVASMDSGGRRMLFAAGAFTQIDGQPVRRISHWDGVEWSQVGAGFDSTVLALFAHDDGPDPSLYAGQETTALGHPNALWRWSGNAWDDVGGEIHGDVWDVTIHDAGGGPVPVVVGLVRALPTLGSVNVARWDGASWLPLSEGLNRKVDALAVVGHGPRRTLVAAGDFASVGAEHASYVAAWDGTQWRSLDMGAHPVNVNALAFHTDATGSALFAGGTFTHVGGVPMNRIARFDGAGWSAMGAGIEWVGGLNALVLDMTTFDDGSGPVLVVGGSFTLAGGLPANHIASWDGSSWTPLGEGLDDRVRALEVFDDGTGPMLYAAGEFSSAGGQPTGGIARWDGSAWSPVGAVVFGTALTIFDGGNGPALFACAGSVTPTVGSPFSGVARWDGDDWSSVGNGGLTATAFGVPTVGIVSAMRPFRDGSGGGLYVAGFFDSVGGVPAENIARWDGTSWSAVGGGTNERIADLAVFDDGSGPALYAGGEFTLAHDSGDAYLARWGGCAAGSTVWTDLEGGSGGAAGPAVLSGSGELGAGSSGSIRLTGISPDSHAWLVVSARAAAADMGCGVLLPAVDAVVALSGDDRGDAVVGWSTWPTGLSGVALYMQGVTPDPGSACGLAFSNALRADVP